MNGVKMDTGSIILRELLKRGYSLRNNVRAWDVSDSKLWFLTPELSKGFLKIKDSSVPYRKNILEPEVSLLKKNAGEIVKMLGQNSFNLIDLACGTGNRVKDFVESMPSNVRIRYSPVNVDPYFVGKSSEKVGMIQNEKIAGIKPFISDINEFENIIGLLRTGEHQSNLVLLLSSRISHHEINEILFELSNGMFRGDVLVIGNGLRKGERFVDLKKYKHPLFNEWFIHIMNGLGFKDDEVEYDARFGNGRVEGFYRIKVDKIIENNGRKVQFKKGDEIIVAVQYKFYEPELKDFCKMYFCDVKVLKSADEEYALILCKK